MNKGTEASFVISSDRMRRNTRIQTVKHRLSIQVMPFFFLFFKAFFSAGSSAPPSSMSAKKKRPQKHRPDKMHKPGINNVPSLIAAIRECHRTVVKAKSIALHALHVSSLFQTPAQFSVISSELVRPSYKLNELE